MLNAEKYAEQLKESGINFAFTINGKFVKCEDCNCHDCLFENDCMVLRLKWLVEECKESILTLDEYLILRNIVKFFKVSGIYKTEICHTNIRCLNIDIEIDENNGWTIEIPLVDGLKDNFKKMEVNKTYSLEGLKPSTFVKTKE